MGGAGPRITAFVVAGGRSRRMGRDKALLAWGGGTLLDHALARLAELSDDVRLLCGPEPRYRGRAPLVLDAFGDAGPLGGVASGLAVLERALGVFLAVDLPHVPVALLTHLASLAGEADAVVPETERGPEPLCAVYTPACRAPVERALARGDLKMTSFWSEVRVRRVAPPELQRFGDPARLFQNVNAPEDYDQARGDARCR